jgi:hypothetical protein
VSVSADADRQRAQPFLVHVAGDRRHFTELPGVSDGAVCFMQRAALTGVDLVKPDELVFMDIGLPPRDLKRLI